MGFKISKLIIFVLGFLGLCLPGLTWAKTGQLSLTVDILGALPNLNLPSGANRGLGFSGTADYRLTDAFAFGLTGGMVEFLAPTGSEDMKTTWLDLMGRLYPLPKSPLGEPYLQLGFGFSPYIGGIFEDYWSRYAATNLGAPTGSGTVYLATQGAIGFLLSLGEDVSLDAGIQYDLFWPPTNPLLQTYSLRLGLVRSFNP